MAYLTNVIKNVEGTSISIDDSYKLKDFVLEGDTYQEGTPTPDSPQDIHVVSGDNSIEVCGKNLIPFTNQDFTLKNVRYYVNNGSLILNGTSTGETLRQSADFKTHFSFYLEPGTYMFRTKSRTTNIPIYVSKYSDDTIISNINGNTLNNKTFTLTEKTQVYLSFYIYNQVFENDNLELMLELGNQATTYKPYTGASYPINLPEGMELCKIGDYQDKIDKSSGKNLFDYQDLASKIQTFTTSGTANNFTLVGYGTYQYPISISTNEIISGSWSTTNLNGDVKAIYEDDTNANIFSSYTSSSASGTISFIPTKKVKAIQFRTFNSNNNITLNNFMINEGTNALPYEPYGTGWYLKKEIGKVVLNGSENWGLFFSTNGVFINSSTITSINSASTINCISNYYANSYSRAYIRNNLATVDNVCATNNNELILANKSITSVADFQTWLSNNNTTLYYVLATPTYTKITNQELISQLEAVRLLEGVNNITVDSPYLSSILSLDYYSQENPYQDAIYSQDDSNDLKIYFNDVELEDAGRYCEKITRIARILPNDGGKRFSLDNFISTSVEVILHNVDIEDIVDQVRIEIGTDIGNNTFEYVPLGVFNIQDTPEKDGNKITLKLRDNRVKFDFNYNAYPLIQSLGGSATKKQILDDICEQAGVECLIDSFNGDSDLIGIYDSTISATTYVSYLMEQAGLIPVIDRYGRLIAIDLSQLDKWRIPLSIVESYEKGSPYGIERVVYESGTLKYETSDDDTLDTLYLNSANPYVSSNSQVSYILDKLQDFNIDSVTTKRVLGNPAIDPYDIIEVYNDLDGSNDIVFRTLGNTTYTFNGVHRDVFDTQIGKEERTENVTIRGLPAFQKYAKVEIDNMNATITQTVTSVEELQESIDLFSVDLSQYNVVIATDSDRKPYTTETVAVNYYGYYKGQQVTPTVAITGSESNVTVTTSNTAINFKVTQGNAIANKSYTYTATFTYNDAGTTYTVAKKIVLSLSIEGKAGQDGQDGQDGRDGTDGTSAYFYVRYSANADGSNMTVAPQSDTKYMGVASTTSSTPPTQPSGYVWSEIRGEDGQDGQQGIPGQPGADGTSSYLHIKWSDDGTSFTPAEGSTPAGKTPGRWQGTYVDTNQTDSTVFSDYNWVDTGIYVQDELNSLETSIGEVNARVTDTNTNLNNNYYNKGQVDALSEANANNIATVTQRVVTLEQKSDSYAININKILTNGVSSVTTATGYVFNENGLNISKTGSEMANLVDNTGMFVKRNNTEMLGADATGVRTENLLVRKYLIMGTNSRFEDYETSRTACFYIGGSS